MHELSLMKDVVRIVSLDAAGRGFRRVSRIHMEVGELSGALPHALKAAFPVASRGTIVEGAELWVDEIRAGIRCGQCGCDFLPTEEGWACPECGSKGTGPMRGTELQVVSYTGEEYRCR